MSLDTVCRVKALLRVTGARENDVYGETEERGVVVSLPRKWR